MAAEQGGKSGGARVHLVLSSGGMKCISYIGALKVLEERGVEFASVSACSGGAVIGALLCAGMKAREMEEKLAGFETGVGVVPRWLRRNKYARMLMLFWQGRKWPFAVLSKPVAPEFFRRIHGDGDPTLKQLQPPFSTIGLDLRTERLMVFSGVTAPDMRVSEALGIANAVPFMVEPREHENWLLVDAALASQCPVWLAAGYDDGLPIVALNTEGRQRASRPDGPLEFLGEVMDAAVGSRDYHMARQIPRVRMITINSADVEHDQFDLTPDERRYLVAQGRVAAEAALETYGPDFRRPAAAPPPAPDARRDPASEGVRLIDRFHEELSGVVRDKVFVSYSRKDAKWLAQFKTAFQPYARNEKIEVWDDTRIEAGENWKQEIDRALASTKVAVLLVTQNYLASEFIAKEELPYFADAAELPHFADAAKLPYFADAAKRPGLTVVWVAVTATGRIARPPLLAQLQAANNPEIPLETLPESEQRQLWIEVCDEVIAAYKRGLRGSERRTRDAAGGQSAAGGETVDAGADALG